MVFFVLGVIVGAALGVFGMALLGNANDDWRDDGMTREEREAAIDIINCLAWHDIRPSDEEIEKVIEALKAQPCEDAVSREAFKQKYKEEAYEEGLGEVDDDWLAIRVIDVLPPVTPAIPTSEDAIDRSALRARFNHLDEVYEEMSEE